MEEDRSVEEKTSAKRYGKGDMLSLLTSTLDTFFLNGCGRCISNSLNSRQGITNLTFSCPSPSDHRVYQVYQEHTYILTVPIITQPNLESESFPEMTIK